MSQPRVRVLRGQRKIIGPIEIVNPHAAGIDAGSEEHWVSVPEDRDEEPVRAFGTFTDDLHELADWLIQCGIETVAIEATGVYWMPLYEVLEVRGLNPKLVDSRSIGKRNKKTDVLDCQWLRQLHTHGLLNAGFRPESQVLRLRSYMRQRRTLIAYASDHIRHMQKALDQMNLKLHLVLSDITGVSGMRIIHAILNGERDPEQLATMREPGCKHSDETVAKALIGNYREEHLFGLRQSVELVQVYQEKLRECDERIAAELEAFEKRADRHNLPAKKKLKRRKNQPAFDGHALLYEMAGVDLTAIPGMEVSTALTVLSETGTDMSSWPSEGHFASWLDLCPNRPRSGKRKKPPRKQRMQPNRAAQAFRLAAQTLERAKCGLGAHFRRICSRHGRAYAITATAHKLAIVFYSMLKNQTEYCEPGENYYEQRYRERLLKSLKRNAAMLGFQLVPLQEVH